MKRSIGQRACLCVSHTRLVSHCVKQTRFMSVTHLNQTVDLPPPPPSPTSIASQLLSHSDLVLQRNQIAHHHHHHHHHHRLDTFSNLQNLFAQETSMALQRLSKVLKQRVRRGDYGIDSTTTTNNNNNNKMENRKKVHLKYMQQLTTETTTNTNTTKSPPWHLQSSPSKDIQAKYEMATLLRNFDPQSPPPPTASLLDVQLWLECESQRESVLRMESALESAKSRQDFISLPIMKQHLLQWYHPLRNRIEYEQRTYLSGEGAKQGKVDFKRYGPFLCTIQPEKLAILTIHEAIYVALSKGGVGSTLTQLAVRMGDAVEAELNVQRALKSKVMKSSLTTTKTLNVVGGNTTVDENSTMPLSSRLDIDDDDNTTTTQPPTPPTLEKNSTTTDTWMYSGSHLQQFMDEIKKDASNKNSRALIRLANRRARKIIDSSEEWTSADKVKLGSALIQMLLESTRVLKDNRWRLPDVMDEETYLKSGEPAFTYEKRWVGEKKLTGLIVMNEWLYRVCLEDKFESLEGFTSRYQPMIVPPRPWIGPRDGGYYALNVDLMRTHGCQNQREALLEADLSTVLDGLNVLGRVPWKVNKEILDVAQRCWDEGIPIGDIPSRKDFELPPEPFPIPYDENVYKDKDNPGYKAAMEEYKAYCEAKVRYRRIYQKNMDLRSLRCSALLKLNQAKKFQDFEKIYFPYNLDFRGRSYPVPPHFSNIGSDLCRGMLMLAESKPLGTRGLFWLKVHVANLAGKNKMSFEDRAKFTDDNMQNIRECVNDPFGSNRWWMKSLEDPFQGLAACNEIIRAIDSGDPTTYRCNLPVHMDGSCNGLQHYAALGRDKVGGKAVNLCDYDTPQDVYIGVMIEVIRRVAEEAAKELPFDVSDISKLNKAEKDLLKRNRAAKLVNGLIDRGVVKRTVMTSVYGVTFIGARNQIREKIEEKLEGKGYDVDEIENEVHAACGYLARTTMEVIGELFTGAKQTMGWLSQSARLIASQGQPVSWMTAIGVPAVQPYRQRKPYTVVTLLQSVILMNNSDNLPIHKQRQVSAFPPNYVHSLDSSHMLLTALEMDRRALAFSAVHDSFWTHACDVDEMNQVLRDCFVDLYSRPLLEELRKTWELQYPSLQFPDLPEKGELDLTEVKRAKFFFQ